MMARTANARVPAVATARVRFRDKRPRYSSHFANQPAPRPGAIYARPMAIAAKQISIRKSMVSRRNTVKSSVVAACGDFLSSLLGVHAECACDREQESKQR